MGLFYGKGRSLTLPGSITLIFAGSWSDILEFFGIHYLLHIYIFKMSPFESLVDPHCMVGENVCVFLHTY